MNKQEIIQKCQELRLQINLVESQVITNMISLDQAESMMKLIEKQIRLMEEAVLN